MSLKYRFLVIVGAASVAWTGCSASGEDTDGGTNSGGSSSGSGGAGGGLLGTGAQGSFNGEACGESTFGNAVPASVLVVLDKSGSMSGNMDEGIPEKWTPTTAALNSMMSQAPPDLEMGLLPFPAGEFDSTALLGCNIADPTPQCEALLKDGGCEDVSTTPEVPVGPLSTTQSQISGYLSSEGPGGGTPTLDALRKGYAYLQSYPAEGERYVILMTDGEPQTYTPEMMDPFGFFTIPEANIECKTEADMHAETLAAAQGTPAVKTFVIGSPGSEPAAGFLSTLAENGQTPKDNCTPGFDCHYQIGQGNLQQDLEAVLTEIAGKISDCIFALPDGDDVDPDLVNVKIETPDGQVLEILKDPTHQDGWDYTDENQTHIQLFGEACATYQAAKSTQINIVLGCATVSK